MGRALRGFLSALGGPSPSTLAAAVRCRPSPGGLLAIPDAIRQLEELDRTRLTRRDIEQLFGVSRARAATLMQTFGAELTGNQRTLPPDEAPPAAPKTPAGPPSAAKRNGGRGWWPSSGRRG